MFQSKKSWVLVVLAVFILPILVNKEYRRFNTLYDFCQKDAVVYQAYLDTDACSIPRLRRELEHRELVRCTEIEELLALENPSDCTLKLWLRDGPIGYVIIEWGGSLVEKITGYIFQITVISLVIIGIYMTYGPTSKSHRNNVQMAYAMGYLHGGASGDHFLNQSTSHNPVGRLQHNQPERPLLGYTKTATPVITTNDDFD